MKKTTILEPLPCTYSEKKRKDLKMVFETIQKVKEKEESLKMTFEEFLKSMSISYDKYILAVRSSLKKPQISLKRNPTDMFIRKENDTTDEKQHKYSVRS